jgi:hypothetical protein
MAGCGWNVNADLIYGIYQELERRANMAVFVNVINWLVFTELNITDKGGSIKEGMGGSGGSPPKGRE